MSFPFYPKHPTERNLKALVSLIYKLPSLDQLPTVRDFLIKTVEAVELGTLDRETACYFIAEFMFLATVEENQQYADICLAAGRLELPERHVGDGLPLLWQGLTKRIRDLPFLG